MASTSTLVTLTVDLEDCTEAIAGLLTSVRSSVYIPLPLTPLIPAPQRMLQAQRMTGKAKSVQSYADTCEGFT
jgi:hypothetical protein